MSLSVLIAVFRYGGSICDKAHRNPDSVNFMTYCENRKSRNISKYREPATRYSLSLKSGNGVVAKKVVAVVFSI